MVGGISSGFAVNDGKGGREGFEEKLGRAIE